MKGVIFMRDDIKKLLMEAKLVEPVLLTDHEVEYITEKYKDTGLPEDIIKKYDSDIDKYLYYRIPNYDDFRNEEINILLQLKTNKRLKKINNHLVFYSTLIIISLIIAFLYAVGVLK